MSYINPNTFKLNKRRHPTKHVAQDEVTVDKLNQVVDEANDKLARLLLYSQNLEEQVTALFKENQELRKQIVNLEKENQQSRKQVKPKAGKKRDAWEFGEGDD